MQEENKQSVPPVEPTPPASSPTPAPVKNNTIMGILAYIGPLVIISYLTSKEDPFVKFHIKQGLVLLAIEVIVGVAGSMVWMLWPILQLVHFAAIVLSIIGIINVAQNKQKELPVVGSFAKHFDKI